MARRTVPPESDSTAAAPSMARRRAPMEAAGRRTLRRVARAPSKPSRPRVVARCSPGRSAVRRADPSAPQRRPATRERDRPRTRVQRSRRRARARTSLPPSCQRPNARWPPPGRRRPPWDRRPPGQATSYSMACDSRPLFFVCVARAGPSSSEFFEARNRTRCGAKNSRARRKPKATIFSAKRAPSRHSPEKRYSERSFFGSPNGLSNPLARRSHPHPHPRRVPTSGNGGRGPPVTLSDA